mmetsp:Transcript_15406/g.24890  ORF Transcript_15406/g.24890 Transcript_15406/m.24890 type:complete len:239 (+) Transcript_15406:127-843(+)|eukprot:CAMPEP_0171488498 /NCGR_PEP_ID=MMETSP0958-20121227/2236_1 /TAXON_ID=87120 /ORGANISM="Aurantiochytrium limacinum, Strain ATCCMYA-1381" /LENGTH=238 /DNA_ID=CAMNT_0012021609 /DNA_START=48 /DNA_END=764 /DNA_ORIENTATION=-
MAVRSLRSLLALAALCLSAVACAGDNLVSEAFLKNYPEENSDVVTLESGIMYRVIESSTRPTAKSPMLTEFCRLNYEGKLVNGEVFDSSLERGESAIFKPSQLIAGWREILLLMEEGDKWEVVIPSELGYGDNRNMEAIPPGSALVFYIELLEVDPQFHGMEWLKLTLKKEVPGLPFNMTWWQLILLVTYMTFRFLLRRYMDQQKTQANATAAATKAENKEKIGSKAVKEAKESKKAK